MRKHSKKFSSSHSSGRNTVLHRGADGKVTRGDTCALAHKITHDKGVQLGQAYCLFNLLRRVEGFWLPRNTGTQTPPDVHDGSVRDTERLNRGEWGDAKGLLTRQVELKTHVTVLA